MAIQEIFKLLLDGKEFGAQVQKLADQWEKFRHTVSSKDISFTFNANSLKQLQTTINRESNNIVKIAEKLNKSFDINIKAPTLLTDIKKLRDKAQSNLDKNPITLLQEIKIDLKKLKKNAQFITAEELGIEKEKATRQIASLQDVLGKQFTSAFKTAGGLNNFGTQIDLVTKKIASLGKNTNATGKEEAKLQKFIKALDAALIKINKSAEVGRDAKSKLDFFSTLEGFSPEFLASLEQFVRLTKTIEEGGKVKKTTLDAAEERVRVGARLDQKRINNAKDAAAETEKIVLSSEDAQLRATERGGKAVLESVKRVGLKITEANGDTFRPLGEAVTDFSKSAEDALERAQRFQAQATAFKVPANNPLSPANLQKNVTLQETLNKKIQDFLILQRRIRETEAESADLAIKAKSQTGVSLDEGGKLADTEDTLNRLKTESLNLTAELNTLQKESLITEKAITAELAKQLRLDADRSKIFKTISEKEIAKSTAVAGLRSPVTDLPTGLPKADAVREDFKRLEAIEQDSLAKRQKVNDAAIALREAQNDTARQTEVKGLQDALNQELDLLKKSDTEFNRLSGGLPRKIAAASKQASAEFAKIRDAAELDALEKQKISAAAREKAAQQETVTNKLRQRGANQEIIALNEELLRAQRSLDAQREQEATAAQNKLTQIEQAGTLKRVQEAGIVSKPAATVSTDTFAKQVQQFEQQLPKFNELIQRRVSLEDAGNALSLSLTKAKTQAETAIIQKAIVDNAAAQKQAASDIEQFKAGLGQAELKRLTDQTKIITEQSKASGRDAEAVTKSRIAQEEKLNAVRLRNQRIDDEIDAKAKARSTKIDKVIPQIDSLATLPSVEDAKANFAKLQDLNKRLSREEIEVRKAAKEVLSAVERSANKSELDDLKATLRDRLAELRKFHTEAITLVKSLSTKIAKATLAEEAELKRIRDEATADVNAATVKKEQARTKIAEQEKVIRGKIERGATAEVVKEHESLLVQLQAIHARREQDERESQQRLAQINSQGTFKQIQSAGLDKRPEIGIETDKVASLAEGFEKQLPRIRELILQRLDIERRGHDLSVALTKAKTVEEFTVIKNAQAQQLEAAKQSQRDLDAAKAGVEGAALKALTDETDLTIEELKKREAAALKVIKQREADEQKELNKHHREIAAAEKRLDVELALLDQEQVARQKFQAANLDKLTSTSNSEKVLAAKAVDKQLEVVERQRLERIRVIEKEIAQLRAHPPGVVEVPPVGAPPGTPPVPVKPPVITPPPSMTGVITDLRKLQSEQDKANAKGTFFNEILKGFEKNIGQSVGSVIKFQLAWRLAGPLISAALLPIEGIGLAIQTGIEHLARMQEKVVQLREILLQNVRFSADVSTNFALGTESAEKLAKALEFASTKVNTSTEVFQQVFESFVQSGGLQTVGGDLQKAVDLVALIIQDLGSVGISLQDARRAVSEVSKLLTEGVTPRDALPRALKRSSDELASIVRTAKEEGNLFEAIAALSSNQAKSLQLSDKLFARLLDKITVFLKIFSGAFSKGLFDASLSGLQRIIEVFEKNEATIVNFANSLGSVFGSVLTTLTDIAAIIGKIASINPFKDIANSVEKTQTALQSLEKQIESKASGTDKGAITGAFTVGPAAVARVVGAINQAIDRAIGNIELTKLPEKTLVALTDQRSQLVKELQETSVKLIEEGRKLEKAGSDSIKKQITQAAVPIFEERQKLLTKILEIDKILKKAPATTATGLRAFLNNTIGKPLQDAQLTLPKEAEKLGTAVGTAIDAGLADAQVAVKRRLDLIQSDLQIFTSSIESNEARFRELTDLRFSQGAFNEVGKTQEVLDSLQRQLEDTLSEVDESKKRTFGDTHDIQKFNDELEQSNNRIGILAESIAKLTEKEVALSLATGETSDAARASEQVNLVVVQEQLKKAKEDLAATQKRADELQAIRRRTPGLTEARDDAEKRHNVLVEQAGKTVRDIQIAQTKARHDLNLVLKRDREEKFKDDLDATREALKQAEDLFKEASKVRVVDESESIQQVRALRQAAIQQELADIEREKKTALAVSIPRQRQLATQAAKLRRESSRLDELAGEQIFIALAKKEAFEKAFQDKRVEFQKEANAEILQVQIQDGLALESALIDQQERLILKRHANAQEDLDRQIEIAKEISGLDFDKSGDFERKQQELRDQLTRDLVANSQARVIQLRREAEELRRIAIERLNVERAGIEQVIQLQDLGILSDNQRFETQLKLAQINKVLADAQLALAQTELQRLQVQQAALPIAQRNIALLEQQANAVEALRQAELRSAIDLRIAQNRRTAGVGRRALEGLTGLDLTSARAARAVIGERIVTTTAQLSTAKNAPIVNKQVVAELEATLKKLTADFNNLRESGLMKFGKGVKTAVDQIINAVNAVIQGFQSGGVGGAVGAGLSQVGTIFEKALGAAGPIVQAAGAVVSVIASAFQAAARRLAEKIKKAFDKTLEEFRDQTKTLGRTIGELEKQRLSAIERLSGKKGGKKQLEELLPEFDRAIKDLVAQQKEIQDSFEDELGALRLGNDALRDFSKSWDDVNDKVQQYIDSFREGEFTLEKQQNAVEFLSRSLGQLRDDLLDSLGDAEKEAIQNALDLNDLLEDRVKLMKEIAQAQEDFNKAQFDLLTADAIEARVAGVVERGNKIVQLRKDFEEDQAERKQRLADLNREIAAKQRQFLLEQSIFNLSRDRTTLLNRQDTLTEQSLDRQIQKWKDIQAIIDGIVKDPVTGAFSLTGGLNSQLSPRITNVTVGAPNINIEVNTGGAPLNSREITDPLTAFFADQRNFGFNNS